MKTKREIIEDTVKHYNSGNLATQDGHCMYVTESGLKCALGRCMTEEKAKEANTFTALSGPANATGLVQKYALRHDLPENTTYNEILDGFLQEEYKGHDIQFWADLQKLHDRPKNWTTTGLSEEGKDQYSTLLHLWGDK